LPAILAAPEYVDRVADAIVEATGDLFDDFEPARAAARAAIEAIASWTSPTPDDDAARLLALLVAICGPGINDYCPRIGHAQGERQAQKWRDFRPEAGMKWLSLYSDVVSDPKVQRLPGDKFKAWINLLCVASQHDGILPPLADLAFTLRTAEDKITALLDDLATSQATQA
jgi:hypothetical protein